MNTLQSPKGITFYQWPTDNEENKGIFLYLCGGGSKPENPLNSTFAKEFVLKNKDKFQCFAGALPAGRPGWDFPIDNMLAGEYIARYIKETFPYNGDFTYSGWSAGASLNPIAKCGDFVTTIVICAGGGDYQTIIEFGKKNIPGRWYHAIDDGAIPITKARNNKIAYGPAMQLIEIASGGHSAAPNVAFDPSGDLAEWVISKGKPVTKPDPIDSGKSWYYSESEKVIIFETVGGKQLRVTPD